MRILMVHGLGRTPVSFLRLACRLRRHGCETVSFPYAAFAQSFEGIVSGLLTRLERTSKGSDYAVIGHSLGGVLLRAALPRMRGPLPRHLVMLGTPNRPPRAARLAWALPPFRWVSGECGSCLASSGFYATLPRPLVPYTIIAGTRGLTGRWTPFGAEPNDGLVAVSETLICENDPVITFPVFHTFMMNDTRVLAAIRAALGIGSDGDHLSGPPRKLR